MTEKFDIRPLELSDAMRLSQLISQLRTESNTFDLSQIRDAQLATPQFDQATPTVTLVAYENRQQQPVGLATIEKGELGVAVLNAYQGQGLGTQLCTVLIDWAKQQQLPMVWLDVVTDNIGAHRLYQKLGFEYVQRDLTIQMEMDEQLKLDRLQLNLKP